MQFYTSRKGFDDAAATSLPMFLRPFRRSRRLWRRWHRLTPVLLFAALFVDFILTVVINTPPTRVPPSSTPPPGPASHKDRIFIASIHWNNESVIRSHWAAAILDLVRHFGAENVYVAIIEGGSWDDTKGALRDLDLELEKMGVDRSIEMDDSTHKGKIERIPDSAEEGWIWTSRDRKELRRIPYLAGIRNRVMDKMRYLATRTDGQGKQSFDKVLWLNDVIFTTEDVTTLIATRDGNYAAACSLDFSNPPLYYDTFALRDISGAKAVTQTWPFFLTARSRKAMISNSPVPVKSCWNGIVVFQAEPFYQPLDFRGIPDSLALHHLEGSECCLIHADNSLSSAHGVWLNPNVRVSYNPEAYEHVHPTSGIWPSRGEKLRGIWSNRWARGTRFPLRIIERYNIDRNVRLWRDETHQAVLDGHDDGTYCLINEMQVLIENGWAHV